MQTPPPPRGDFSELVAEAGALSLERMPMLAPILERMASVLAERLRPLAATPLLATLQQPEVTRLGECLDAWDQQAIICTAYAAACDARLVIALERGMLNVAAEAFFGGEGTEEDLREAQPFSTFELRLAETLFEAALTALEEGMAPIHVLDLQRERIETRMELAGAGRRTLGAVCATQAVSAHGRAGLMHVLLPQPLLYALRDELAQPVGPPARPADPGWSAQFRDRLQQADMTLEAVLCEFTATLEDIAHWRPGLVLPIEAGLNRTVRLDHAGQAVLRGALGQVDERYGLRVETFADPDQSFFDAIVEP